MCVCVCDHIFNPTLSQVIISVSFSWLICYILTASNVFSEDEKDITYNARTDTKLQVLYDAAWFRIPYPGKTSYMKWCHGKTIRKVRHPLGGPHIGIAKIWSKIYK